MLQAKLLPDFPAGERRATFLQAGFREITILKVFDVPFDEFAGIERHRSTSLLGKLGKPSLDIGI